MGKKLVVLCDSDVIIKLMRGNAPIQRNLRIIGTPNIALSIITHAEIYYGAKKKQIPSIREKLETFQVCHLTRGISKTFNGLILNYSASHRIKIPDALIAAIANDYELYTDNKKDFDFIPEIQFYNPKS
ncbi:MAG: type II toxin-antitoxin system VapC family toxin [Lewinellaceae bacterium]|nr:type II toxin-antitoxin system VapC family toxin [Saprospiraceae bacterium]MCB9341094.1 type II toxin-antitoxin system VapC family toxin [Lewinellaceae bacterium]